MSALYVGIGFVMLLIGRPAYTVFTGGVGFVVGTYLADRITITTSEWNELIVSMVFATFGVLVALAFRRWAARVAGFLAGGFVIYTLPETLGTASGWESWVVFVIAGIVCVVLMMVWFDISLILISTLTGVTLILQRVSFGSLDNVTMFIVLTMFGIIVQFLISHYGRPSPD